MKTLKFQKELVKEILGGQKTSTWRVNDEKNISINDVVEFINTDTAKAFGVARVDSVTVKRLGEVEGDDFSGHESFDSKEKMYATYRQYYGSDVGPQTPVKIIRFTFDAYQKPREPNQIKQSYKNLKLFADGGSRGNPGPSAAGYVLLDMDDNVVKKGGVYLGITTNNQAEYQALRQGLEAAKAVGAKDVEVYLDSMLVINQMKGIYKVKNRDLWPIHESLKEYLSQFGKVTFTHVPREFNTQADSMVNHILDKTERSY